MIPKVADDDAIGISGLRVVGVIGFRGNRGNSFGERGDGLRNSLVVSACELQESGSVGEDVECFDGCHRLGVVDLELCAHVDVRRRGNGGSCHHADAI